MGTVSADTSPNKSVIDEVEKKLKEAEEFSSMAANPSDDTKLSVCLSSIKMKKEELNSKGKELEKIAKQDSQPISDKARDLISAIERVSYLNTAGLLRVNDPGTNNDMN
ncbi:hypothetical protein LSTR_LSTR016471 [Laodelphax striatellus]|uniref:Uncharacterized protein n=1 Tax=Laodelphax striatellus TaxID=195883 RepID=A0A482WLW1_LAOST|nr:hypothetical protein LSTR_LSTR016471 [Laodelphax striatellus]